MDWVRILAYIAGTVGQELLLRNEYLAAEILPSGSRMSILTQRAHRTSSVGTIPDN